MPAPADRSPRLRQWVIVVALVLGLSAVAVFVLPRLTSAPSRVDFELPTGPESVTGIAPAGPSRTTVTSAAPSVPREAVGDGDDVTATAPADFDELRFVIPGLGVDSTAAGSDVRDSILTRPGTYVRYRTEAVKNAFLKARILCPLEMRPMGDQPGTRLDVLGASIIGSGFDVLYRKPLFRIGALEAGSADPRR